MLTADLYRADDVRVVAWASNGSDITERDEKVTRDDPVLTVDQLTAVVLHPWWGVRLPASFTEQGNLLEPYAGTEGPVTGLTTAPPESR